MKWSLLHIPFLQKIYKLKVAIVMVEWLAFLNNSKKVVSFSVWCSHVFSMCLDVLSLCGLMSPINPKYR